MNETVKVLQNQGSPICAAEAGCLRRWPSAAGELDFAALSYSERILSERAGEGEILLATVRGFVERIKYRNEENGYSVLVLAAEDEEYILVGTFPYITEGEMLEASGSMVEHPIYGEQLQVESFEIKTPEDADAMERYLASGAIKGVGAALAARIVRRFKADTFRVMEEEPERLAEVKGISEKMAMAIGAQMEEKQGLRQATMFLQKYGISVNLAVKIYQTYGARMYGIIEENPYRLADDIPGVGFKMADEIARKVGIFTDSDYRLKSGILYTLLQAVGNGHTYLPEEELLASAAELLRVEPEVIGDQLMDLQMEKKLVIREQDGRRAVYASQYYYLELNSAKMLFDLNIRGEFDRESIFKKLDRIQEEERIELDEMQRMAVAEAVENGLLVITGGPGTGKTTTINTIIRYFEESGMEILLAAPTGRAAKRMTEATGMEAKTIHRLLEITGVPDDKNASGMHFERNEENPLEADGDHRRDVHGGYLSAPLPLKGGQPGDEAGPGGGCEPAAQRGPRKCAAGHHRFRLFPRGKADQDFPPGVPERHRCQRPPHQRRRADRSGKEEPRLPLYPPGSPGRHHKRHAHPGAEEAPRVRQRPPL